MMGLNFGCRIADVTDGMSNTAAIGELRVGLGSLDIRGTWAIGLGMASLCGHAKVYNPTPNNMLGFSVAQGCTDGGDEMQNGPLLGRPLPQRRRAGHGLQLRRRHV